MHSYDSTITLQRRSALAYDRAPIGPACARIFIEHAMFRAQAPGSACCVALRAASRVQALAHVMRLRPRDRVVSPCEPDPSRSILVMEESRRGMPRPSGM